MAAAKQRKVKFFAVPGFGKRYKRFLPNKQVKQALKTFNEAIRKIPPGRLPKLMWDHKLKGRLADVYECHLAGDVLLIYTHEDDIVRLLDCCTHDELMNDGGSAVKKRLALVPKNTRK